MGDILQLAITPVETRVSQQYFNQLFVDRQQYALERRLHTALIKPLLPRGTGDDEVYLRLVLVVTAVNSHHIRGLQGYQGELDRHGVRTLRAHVKHVLDVLRRAVDVVDADTFDLLGRAVRFGLDDGHRLTNRLYNTSENILYLFHYRLKLLMGVIIST